MNTNFPHETDRVKLGTLLEDLLFVPVLTHQRASRGQCVDEDGGGQRVPLAKQRAHFASD